MGKLAKAAICREWNKPVVVEEVEVALDAYLGGECFAVGKLKK